MEESQKVELFQLLANIGGHMGVLGAYLKCYIVKIEIICSRSLVGRIFIDSISSSILFDCLFIHKSQHSILFKSDRIKRPGKNLPNIILIQIILIHLIVIQLFFLRISKSISNELLGISRCICFRMTWAIIHSTSISSCLIK